MRDLFNYLCITGRGGHGDRPYPDVRGGPGIGDGREDRARGDVGRGRGDRGRGEWGRDSSRGRGEEPRGTTIINNPACVLNVANCPQLSDYTF